MKFQTEITKNICFKFCNVQGCNVKLKFVIQIPIHYNRCTFLNQLAEGTKQTAK